MSLLLSYALFALGAIVASFVGVLAGRLNTGTSFLTGRSRCDACNTALPPSALVPIFSHIAFRGRARCCGARLTLLSPGTEILLGGLFALSYLMLGPTPALLGMFLSLALLLALVLYDVSHQILPPRLLTAFVLAGAATGLLSSPAPAVFSGSLLVALLISGSLALIHILSRGRAMGFSDAPLALGLSLLVGSAALPGFIFSFWIGAVIGIAVLAGRPVGSRIGVEVPFAPFLAAGFLLAYFTQWNPFIFIAILSGN